MRIMRNKREGRFEEGHRRAWDSGGFVSKLERSDELRAKTIMRAKEGADRWATRMTYILAVGVEKKGVEGHLEPDGERISKMS